MPAVNYTPLSDTQDAEADVFNAPLQQLDDAIEDMKDGTGVLSAPAITSFANAQHDHEDAAGGGLLTADALDSTGASDGDVATADGAGGVVWEPKLIPLFHRRGLTPIRNATANGILVGTGSIVVDGIAVNKTMMTELLLPTAANWIDGASAEAPNMWVWAYINSDGTLKLHDAAPNYTAPYSTNRVCEARVNQAGWDGTPGNGLDETSVVYDDGAGGQPTGEGDIEAGMVLGVYTDSAYETGRGKASGAGGSKNYRSFALITAVDTGTNTLTLQADHEIAMQDNDYLIVIQPGTPAYLYADSRWWYGLGAVWNNVSSNLLYHTNILDTWGPFGGDDTTTSTTFAVMGGGSAALTLDTMGGAIELDFNGSFKLDAAGYIYLDVLLDGQQVFGDDGGAMWYTTSGSIIFPMGFNWILTPGYHNILPGSHTLSLAWKVGAGRTGTLYAKSGVANVDVSPHYTVREVSD